MTVEIDPSLPHYPIREFLVSQKPGAEFDHQFADIVSLPRGPAYSTDLNVIVAELNRIGWWWHLSHIKATVVPTAAAPGLEGVANNGAAYDREGRPISYSAIVNRSEPAHALCEAFVKAAYDLPDAFAVRASAIEEAMAKTPPSREYMMVYYGAREDERQRAISRFNGTAAPTVSI